MVIRELTSNLLVNESTRVHIRVIKDRPFANSFLYLVNGEYTRDRLLAYSLSEASQYCSCDNCIAATNSHANSKE